MEEQRNTEQAEEIITRTDSIKCKGCGSGMSFYPKGQRLKCNHCGREEDFFQSSNVRELPIGDVLLNDVKWSSKSLTFKCESCGAKIVADNAKTACFCPFCGTSHVVAEEELQGIKPNAVVPFAFGRTRLAELFSQWAKKRLFAPNAFKRGAKADNTMGVYLPYFTFDSRTESIFDGRIGYVHTKIVRTKKGTTTKSYTVWKHIGGTISQDFDDITISAGNRIGGRAEEILPFDKSEVRVFENEYLSGFIAHRYERGIADCWESAKLEIEEALKKEIIRRHNPDVVAYINVKTRYEGVTYKYVLLPVYAVNYSYNGKKYVTYVNGSTGKISGRSPVSPWKVALAVAIGAIALIGAAAIYYYLC